MRFQPRHRSGLRLVLLALLTAIFSFIFWIYVSLHELTTGKRLLPWHAYGECAPKPPESLPTTVRIGFYEEFPNPWRLAKLSQLDFPITLAIAAPNRQEFERLHDEISANYPMVREVIYWPTLSLSEGYYLGGLSEPQAIQRVIDESRDLPLLWDLELPRQPPVSFLKLSERSLHNRPLIGDFFRHHQQPIHIWRTHTSMGLDPLFLRSLGMQYSPDDAAQIRLHLDLYTMGTIKRGQRSILSRLKTSGAICKLCAKRAQPRFGSLAQTALIKTISKRYTIFYRLKKPNSASLSCPWP
jgi:hypothetical protein